MRCLRAPVLVFGLGSTVLLGQAMPQPAVEDLLPASSYACVRFGGLDAAAHAAENMAVGALVQSVLQRLPAELRAQALEAQLDEAGSQVRQHLQQVGISPSTLRAVLGRPMALGVGRLTLEGMGPSVALLVDCRQGREEVQQLAKAVLALARRQAPGLQVEDADVAGMKLHRLWLPHGQGPQVFAGDFGDCYVVSNSRGYLREIAAVMAGRQPSLAHSSALGAARSSLPQPALASLFVNTGPVLSMFAPQLPYEAADIGKALGLSNLDGMFAAVSVGDGGGTETCHLGLSGDPHGLAKAAFSGAVSFEPAKWCGAEAVAFAAGSLDVPAAVDAFGQLLDALPQWAGAPARQEIGRNLGRELRRMGMNGEQLQALLRAFGRRVALSVDLAKGPLPLPEPLMFVEIASWEQVEPLLQQLQELSAQRLGLEWKTRKAGDAVIHYCEVRPGDSIRLTPCYVYHDGMLVLGSQVPNLLAALDQRRHAEDSLYAQPDFAAAMQQNPHACGFAHLRWFRAAELTWRTVETMAGGQLDAHADEIGFGSEVLPDQETVAKALGTSTMALRVDAHGVWLQSRGNFGLACLLAGLGRAVDEVFTRASGRVF